MLLDMTYLTPIVRIRTAKGVATASVVTNSNKSILVSAQHLFSDAQPNEIMYIRHSCDWKPVAIDCVKFADDGSDICAVRINTYIGEGLELRFLGAHCLLGQEARFCGFPLDNEISIGSLNNDWPICLVKGAVLSGFRTEGTANYFLYDALNNLGFSGGPVFSLCNESKEVRMAAVVSGYLYDADLPIRKKNGETETDYYVRPNSGLMKASPAGKAISLVKDLISFA